MRNVRTQLNARSFRKTGFFLLVVLLGAARVRGAQQPTPAATPAASEQAGGTEALHLLTGRSLVVTSPVRITRVSITDPSICDALVVSPTQLVLHAKRPATTSLVIWGDSGEVQTFDVTVDLDTLELTRKIREAFPDQPVRVDARGKVVTISGNVSSAKVGNKIMEVAQALVANKEDLIDLMQAPVLPEHTEVMLQVRFAEVDRTALSQLGVNFISLPPAKIVGTTTTQQFAPPAIQGSLTPDNSSQGGFTLTDLLNVFIWRPDINLAATIEALQARNLLQILAQPNVLTESGKPASFLAGGEFPFPVPQTAGGAGGGLFVTIQFKEFGVRLNFTPTVDSEGLIHLEAEPEVSSLDFSNALRISGFLVPALSTRRVKSSMDLRDGQSFAIAGLMDNRVTEQFSKIPGIGDIPILGKLFQSRALNKSNSELLVLVTPRIVQPLEAGHEPAGPHFPKSFLPPVTEPKAGHSGQ